MTWTFSSLGFVYLITSFITINNAFFHWKRRETLGIIWLTTLMTFASVWLFFSFLGYSVNQIEYKVLFTRMGITASEVFISALFLFVVYYFQIFEWYSNRMRSILFLMLLTIILIEWTNSFHHLVWKSYSLVPEGINPITFVRGPMSYIRNGFIGLLVVSSCLILARGVIQYRGWKQASVLLTLVAILFTIGTYLVSSFINDSTLSRYAMPFGFVNLGLILTTIVFEDLNRLVDANTENLKRTIDTLQDEIITRQNLEQDLRNSQDALASKLASQSNKLTGLYDLILFSNETLDYLNLLTRSLDKIHEVIGCDAVTYFTLEKNRFKLNASSKLDHENQASFESIPSEWLGINRDIRADIDIPTSTDLPVEFLLAGYASCLSKWVVVQDQEIGMLAVFWEQSHPFFVEEIALFGALVDGLGLILENTRLRQAAADYATRQERQRLARDLHDSVSQSIHSLTLSAQTAKKQLDGDPLRLKSTLSHIEISARQALREMRLMLYELQLDALNEKGLIDAIRARLNSVEERAGVKSVFEVKEGTAWMVGWENDLYHIAMEALNNALKHSFASQIRVTLSGNMYDFSMEIRDNGKGFDPENVPAGGMGLCNMQARCEKIGARMTIQSNPEQGTSVQISMSEPATPVLS
jgi:signal transduction histidine kinase